MSSPGSVVVTGPNGNMALLTIRAYAKAHPEDHLVLLVHDPTILPKKALPRSSTVTYEPFDMTDLSAVRQTARTVAAAIAAELLPPIKILVCAAAVQNTSSSEPRVTQDGYEEMVAVNYLAHFALILDLLPSMHPDAQIIIIGSDSHRPDDPSMAKPAAYMPLRTLIGVGSGTVAGSGSAKGKAMQRYGTSKLLQMMMGHELARRLGSHPTYTHTNVTMFNPGPTRRIGLIHRVPFLSRFISKAKIRFSQLFKRLELELDMTPDEASAPALLNIMEDRAYAAAEPLSQVRAGGGAACYNIRLEEEETYGEVNDTAKAKELWRDSAQLLGMSKEKALGG